MGVLDEEAAAVGEYVDFAIGAGEELVPDVAGDGPAAGVDGSDLGAEAAGVGFVGGGP